MDYSAPQEMVKINGVFSDPFSISNGTRQGCPLSPLLFALSLEPFLNKIRLNPDISGLQIGDSEYKISAYADDLRFSMTNSQVSLPNLIESYGTLSNFKINYTKSEGMGIALPPLLRHTLQSNFKFKWATSALKYLGTYIPSNLTNIFALNFLPLLSSIRSLLDKCHRGIALMVWFL